MPRHYRNLHFVLGDQLSDRLASFSDFDSQRDCLCMAEVGGESREAWSSKVRTTLFLSAMRHFAQEQREKGVTVHYRKLDDEPAGESFSDALVSFLETASCEKVVIVRPGAYRVLEELKACCREQGVELQVVEDDSFFATPEFFRQHRSGRKQLRMEYFYREMRRRHKVLLEGDGPLGGKWNFDASNRKSFGKEGPESLFPRLRFSPDEMTTEVMGLVERTFADHPGSLEAFDWPVTRSEALQALADFVEKELPSFGEHQDAMWTGEVFLSHSLLSSSLNLKLLDPREVVAAAVEAYESDHAGIESVEGFVRQILGWREYVRGVYWWLMPDYLERNELEAKEALPEFYWDGKTEMNCIREVVTQTFRHGYAHHIQRLMVTGLYALLHGVDPKEVHRWYLAVYVDAVEWVELPNTLGMSQYADGGVMASKPYVATGKYIKRMSNYCQGCRFNPDRRSGKDACPFTVLYWNFLDRHKASLKGNPRMGLQLGNLERISAEELERINESARGIRADGEP